MGRKSNKEATAKKMKWQESFTHLTNPALFSFELLAVSKFAYYSCCQQYDGDNHWSFAIIKQLQTQKETQKCKHWSCHLAIIHLQATTNGSK